MRIRTRTQLVEKYVNCASLLRSSNGRKGWRRELRICRLLVTPQQARPLYCILYLSVWIKKSLQQGLRLKHERRNGEAFFGQMHQNKHTVGRLQREGQNKNIFEEAEVSHSTNRIRIFTHAISGVRTHKAHSHMSVFLIVCFFSSLRGGQSPPFLR